MLFFFPSLGAGKAELYDAITFLAVQNLPSGFKPGLKAGSRAPDLFLPFPVLPSRWPQSLVPGQPRQVRLLQCELTPPGDSSIQFLCKAVGFVLKLGSSEGPPEVLRPGFSAPQAGILRGALGQKDPDPRLPWTVHFAGSFLWSACQPWGRRGSGGKGS